MYWTMHSRTLAPALLVVCLMASAHSIAQSDSAPTTDFNFVYSAILGTGYYTVGDERILVLHLPFAWRLTPFDEKNRLKIILPVSLGVHDILDDDGQLDIPDQLLTFSFLPGIAWERRQRENWMLVPIAQVGAAWDMQTNSEAWLLSASLRSYAWWDIGVHRLGLGNRILGASQFSGSPENKTGFMMLESGLDWNYPLPLHWRGERLSTSVYILWQHYADDVNINAISGEELALENVYKLGFTFGFRRSVKVLWNSIPIQRVGIAIGRGNTIHGNELNSISLNLGFPLSYD